MNYFWEYCGLISFSIITISLFCFFTNNLLFFSLKKTILELNDVVKPSLITYHKPKEARFITTDELPMLQIWYNQSMNYGIINILGLLTSIALVVSISVFHQLTYIITLGSAMFLGSNLMFYPRAYSHRYRVAKILTNYRALIKMLETIETTPETSNENRAENTD